MTYGLGLSANSGSPGNPGYVDWQQPHTILSRVAETEIIFGFPVLLGASDRTVKAPDGSNSPYHYLGRNDLTSPQFQWDTKFCSIPLSSHNGLILLLNFRFCPGSARLG